MLIIYAQKCLNTILNYKSFLFLGAVITKHWAIILTTFFLHYYEACN